MARVKSLTKSFGASTRYKCAFFRMETKRPVDSVEHRKRVVADVLHVEVLLRHPCFRDSLDSMAWCAREGIRAIAQDLRPTASAISWSPCCRLLHQQRPVSVQASVMPSKDPWAGISIRTAPMPLG